MTCVHKTLSILYTPESVSLTSFARQLFSMSWNMDFKTSKQIILQNQFLLTSAVALNSGFGVPLLMDEVCLESLLSERMYT